MLWKTGPKAIFARFSGRSSHKFEQAVSIKRPMYTTQTGRIQIFDQFSAHFIKTASSSTAKSFVKYCLVYSARKYYIWSLLEWQKMSALSVYLALQATVCASRNTMSWTFSGGGGGWKCEMLYNWTGIPKAKTTIKIVIPIVTFFFPC